LYKVFIPSAGLGTRLGDFSKNLNKALVAINNKPVISHVIEKFPKEIEIVVALGHKGDTVKDYLEIAHFDRKIQFVNIEPFSGPGSGLGYTMLKCKDLLQCPFIFCPNDTIILENIPKPDMNWVGYADIKNDKNYRSLKIESSCVSQLCEKDELLSFDTKPYIGLAGVKDYKKFWAVMEAGKRYGSIEVGESYALREMLASNIRIEARKFTWYDTGNTEQLKIAKESLKTANEPEILEKTGEAIWFVNNRVIKYNVDSTFIDDRVDRAQILSGYVPEILDKRKNLYSYRKINGKTFSKRNSIPLFKQLLRFLGRFWAKPSLNEEETLAFHDKCMDFYKKKTYERVQLYFNRFTEFDRVETINGEVVPSIRDLLELVDWDFLSKGAPVRFHGDLHFENILVDETGNFCLLDWRQNFSGNKKYGDLYYDLAKLMHGLIVSHELVNRDCFMVNKVDDIIEFDIYRKYTLTEAEKVFVRFLEDRDLSVKKVYLLTSLIFLNIAGLHHDPYSHFLFCLGRTLLYKNLLKDNLNNV